MKIKFVIFFFFWKRALKEHSMNIDIKASTPIRTFKETNEFFLFLIPIEQLLGLSIAHKCMRVKEITK